MNSNKKKILIVDDETTNLHYLGVILTSDYEVSLIKNSSEAVEAAKSIEPDLILLDLHMPSPDGFEVSKSLKTQLEIDIPIIFMSASHEKELVEKALTLGAYDYLAKPFSPSIVHAKVKKTLQKTAHLALKNVYKKGIRLMDPFFEEGISGLKKELLFRWIEELVSSIENSQVSLGKLVSFFQDEYTEAAHNVNVSFLATTLGKNLRMQHSQLREIATAAILFDIGKSAIEQEILNKTSLLDQKEVDIMQSHPLKSVQLAKELGVTKPEILNAIELHHEKLDGTGYPNNLVGPQIPLYAQILSVCDIFDALTTERTFRKKYSSFDGLMMMKKEMSSQINEKLVNSLITLLR
ncbi:HD domain-containing phosphohydrolase [Sulfurimonas sp. C5]|uniref:HD domain-containing phosphohydrolase n=1 Tax=Sulfurimonas sp. C5 TaxID=3036947 RepID=UPI00245724D0|nr:HD domain-containing phosphohydrolase [Sulfurimonas sp. C5]MDH4943785.1 response regulator [Sulfurimonas sp. C5]